MISFWSELIDWIADTIAYQGAVQRPLPRIESKDGQEPTIDYLREKAREADSKQNSEPPKTLATIDRKALDKEFWDTM